MAFLSVLLLGLLIFFVMVIGIFIIVVIVSVIVTFLSSALSSLSAKKPNKIVLGIKVFIVTFSGVICAGFGYVLLIILTSTNIINAGDNIFIYNILFPFAGLIFGILCALLVNKIIVNPIINLVKKIRVNSAKKK